MPLGIYFFMDFDGCWVPKWSQVGTKMGSNFDFSENTKNAFGTSPLVPNWVQGIQVGSKNQPKIDPNMESKMECILASIFDTFQWILGGMLGSKIEPKVIQKDIGKMIKATGGFGSVLVRFQEVQERVWKTKAG